MLRYTGDASFSFVQTNYRKHEHFWKEFFDEISVNYFGNRYVEYDVLIKAMEKQLGHYDKETKDKLYSLFN